MAEVVIPNSVVCINSNSFIGWNGKLECLSPSFVYEDNILFNKDKSRIISFRNQKLTSYVIPASVTRIGEFAFSRCESLTEVVIPDSVTSIGDSAFRQDNFPYNLKQELISRFGGEIFRIW